MRTLILLGCVLLFGDCQSVRHEKLGAEFIPQGRQVLYFGHQYTYQNDLDSLFTDNLSGKKPFGIVLYTSLNLNLSSKDLGVSTLLDLDTFFEMNPSLIPVMIMQIDKVHYNDLCSGIFDDILESLALFINNLDRPVYLCLGTEVNNPLYRNDPEDFKSAYRCAVDKLHVHSDKIAYVWYLTSMQTVGQESDLLKWYPGDQYVNWIGTSLFKFIPEHFVDKTLFEKSDLEQILKISRLKDLPVMIVESSAVSVINNLDLKGESLWDMWYRPYFSIINDHKEIKAFSHLNHHWSDTIVRNRWQEQIKSNRIVLGENQYQLTDIFGER